jgi:hypothetical protein
MGKVTVFKVNAWSFVDCLLKCSRLHSKVRPAENRRSECGSTPAPNQVQQHFFLIAVKFGRRWEKEPAAQKWSDGERWNCELKPVRHEDSPSPEN